MNKAENLNTIGETIRMDEPTAPQAYRILKRHIIRCKFVPGTRLSEAEISGMLGVSRQPVREAFITLQNENLVEIRSHRGTFVTKISRAAVSDARFVREAIEADICKLLAKNIDETGCNQLEKILEQQQNSTNDLGNFLKLDEDFHKEMAFLVGKGGVWTLVASLKAHFDRVRYLSSLQKPITGLINQHYEILEFLKSGDSDGIEAVIRNHLREVLKDLPKIEALQPDYFADV